VRAKQPIIVRFVSAFPVKCFLCGTTCTNLGAAAEIALGGGELKPSGVTNKYKQQAYSSSQGCHTATGFHMPHRITQCYLPPGRGDIPALTSAEAGIRLSDPGVTNGGRADGGGGGNSPGAAGEPTQNCLTENIFH